MESKEKTCKHCGTEFNTAASVECECAKSSQYKAQLMGMVMSMSGGADSGVRGLDDAIIAGHDDLVYQASKRLEAIDDFMKDQFWSKEG